MASLVVILTTLAFLLNWFIACTNAYTHDNELNLPDSKHASEISHFDSVSAIDSTDYYLGELTTFFELMRARSNLRFIEMQLLNADTLGTRALVIEVMADDENFFSMYEVSLQGDSAVLSLSSSKDIEYTRPDGSKLRTPRAKVRSRLVTLKAIVDDLERCDSLLGKSNWNTVTRVGADISPNQYACVRISGTERTVIYYLHECCIAYFREVPRPSDYLKALLCKLNTHPLRDGLY